MCSRSTYEAKISSRDKTMESSKELQHLVFFVVVVVNMNETIYPRPFITDENVVLLYQ